jgi:capsular polysaccharide biosynthesis protein
VAASAAAVAFLFARLQSPVYRSTVRLEVSGDLDYGNTLAIEKRLQQFAQRIKTTRIALEVDRNLRTDLGPEALLEKIRVAAIPENLQIQVDVDDVSPERAQLIAREIAQVFEFQHTASEQGKVQEKQVLITPLDQPSEAALFWPQTRVLVLAAALLGLVLGVVLVFGLEYFDDTLKTPEDVDRFLGLTTLGVVPVDPFAARPRHGRARGLLLASR